MHSLIDADLQFIVRRLPKDIQNLLTKHAGKLFVAGGFVRALIAGEDPNDIDIFGGDRDQLTYIAKEFAAARPGAKVHVTQNAVTVITPDRLPVQFITRWTFDNAEACAASFDFTVCQSVVWRDGALWRSMCSDRFYIDLAARRLFYTEPMREEEAGGSMLRVLKYVRRGYTIQVTSLGAVIARLADKVDRNLSAPDSEHGGARVTTSRVIAGLLREVDPLIVVDGFDVIEDQVSEGENNG